MKRNQVINANYDIKQVLKTGKKVDGCDFARGDFTAYLDSEGNVNLHIHTLKFTYEPFQGMEGIILGRRFSH